MNFFEITLNQRQRILYSKCNQVKFNIYAKIIFYFNLYLNSFGLQIEKFELSKFNNEIKIEYPLNAPNELKVRQGDFIKVIINSNFFQIKISNLSLIYNEYLCIAQLGILKGFLPNSLINDHFFNDQ